ncbi:NAD(+)/NADH kinase [Candidatus Woesearchaeota archaeon]|nr:NAD(+)/NADH kinase [Candidatus Woesearchaeota archaeon]
METGRALVLYTASSSKKDKEALTSVLAALRSQKMAARAVERRKLSASHFRGAGVCVAVGGDGTFLYAAHFIPQGKPVIGVNSDPKRKEGYLLAATAKTFPTVLKKFLEGKAGIRELPTLECAVNGKRLPAFAVNEFYAGALKSYRTSRYEIVLGNRKEVHRSSGIIAATPQGVNAWARSAGMSIHIPAGSFAYVVREPYENKVFSDYRLKKGIIRKGQRLAIISKMKDGVVVADSLGEEFPLKFNDVVRVGLSGRTVRSVVP